MILIPFYQLGQLEPFVNEDDGLSYPPRPTGLVIRGQDVYRSQGCVYCHTQQVRPNYQGGDIERGWGPRRTVARDYIYETPAMLGYMRMGPDLANAGSDQRVINILQLRNEERFAEKTWQEIREMLSDDEWKATLKAYEAWLHEHLYNPRSVTGWSIMPSFHHLYKQIPLEAGDSYPEALKLAEVKNGFQVVPTPEAEALVAYLMSLNRTYALPEAPQ